MKQPAETTDNQLPKALWVWDNEARFSLPPGLLAWLGLLVLLCLGSVLFVREHAPARWLLGGFFLSHIVVFGLPAVKKFTMRRGFVSLMHVLCWTPGLVTILADFSGRTADLTYSIWSWLVAVVLAISLAFDLRDAATYLSYLRSLPTSPLREEQNEQTPT